MLPSNPKNEGEDNAEWKTIWGYTRLTEKVSVKGIKLGLKPSLKYIITMDGIPVSFPVNKTECGFLLTWLQAINIEEIDDYQELNMTLDRKGNK